MSWVKDGAPGHEGWVANVLADGRVSGSSVGVGVVVTELTAADLDAKREVRRYPDSDDVDVIVPWEPGSGVAGLLRVRLDRGAAARLRRHEAQRS